ncbi:hypothetical protein GCM10022279_21050 [Comamonas faecalis]|uniref:Chemotaxis protein n=1 Tax=Comamonas faecalis TaxID=1387849 RepID=A0ABP7RGP3_9BURK
MNTTINNAAREAAPAQPCPKMTDARAAALEALDEAERLHATLRAGECIADLVANASGFFSLSGFADLLDVYAQAVDLRVSALAAQLGAIDAATTRQPLVDSARTMVADANDLLYSLRRDQGALNAFAGLAAYAADACGEQLGDALGVMTQSATRNLDALAVLLGSLHAAARAQAERAAAGVAA